MRSARDISAELNSVETDIDRIREQLRWLRQRRNSLKTTLAVRRARGEEASEVAKATPTGHYNDPLAVPTAELAKRLIEHEGPLLHLALKAGVNPSTLYNIKRLKTKFTAFGIADNIMSAMGIPLSSTDIRIVANPHFNSKEKLEDLDC